jgi:hypothetical protein
LNGSGNHRFVAAHKRAESWRSISSIGENSAGSSENPLQILLIIAGQLLRHQNPDGGERVVTGRLEKIIFAPSAPAMTTAGTAYSSR